VWELIFLMVILKIPIAYLCWVVYWAIKAEPHPDGGDGARIQAPIDGEPPVRPWSGRPRRPARPHGGPTRRYARTRRAATPYSKR
jgi:hypothetical protein